MDFRSVSGHPVVIIGAGRGGSALLEMFMEDHLATVVAIADSNPDAPGFALAKRYGVPTFLSATEALHACKVYPDCIVYNLSHDDRVADEALRIFGDKKVTSGPEVKLFWQMVTNLKQVKHELEKSQSQLQAIIQNVMDGIITLDESGAIHGFNPAAESIFGYASSEVLGRDVRQLLHEAEGFFEGEGGSETFLLGSRGEEVTAVRSSGQTFPMELSASEMTLGGQRYFIWVVRDITERKEAEERIARLAHYDYLTNLPNRASFLNILEHSVELAKRNSHKVAVLFIDLDGFKQVNDTLGHEAGDILLKGVSERFTQAVRASDTVARLGGDEFIVLLENIGQADNAAVVAEKVIASLSDRFDLNGRIGKVGASIGIAMYPEDAEEVSQLVNNADAAMYRAKHGGKNIWVRYGSA